MDRCHCFSPIVGQGEYLGSREERAGLKLPPLLFLSLGNFLELALNLPGSRERPAIHLFERIVRGIKDETARQPDGDPDGPALQFDCKSLHAHCISPGEQLRPLADGPRGCPVVRLSKNCGFASDAFR
jgi:hypothetical protein